MKTTESNMSSPVVIGVDIGKEVFHLVGFGIDGKIAFRRKIRRLALKDVFEKLPPCIVSLEVCLSVHFVSRTLRALVTSRGSSRRSRSNPSDAGPFTLGLWVDRSCQAGIRNPPRFRTFPPCPGTGRIGPSRAFSPYHRS
jgi:hypothetical protein